MFASRGAYVGKPLQLLDVVVEDIVGRADAVKHNRPEPERQQFRTPSSGPSMGM
ncbi:hypothetical protein JYG56_22985 [Escherichia fergusonii]|nr:hypothetical protein [Escherichia fergusonii]